MMTAAYAEPAQRRRKFVLLDHKEYQVPDFDESGQSAPDRIAKVIPLLTRTIMTWLKSLRERERAQYDIDDVLQEAWLILLKKDHYYDPLRGKYSTFSVMILTRFLADLRNRCHIVDSPRDTTARLGKADEQAPETLERIRQSIRDVGSLEDDLLDRGDDPTVERATHQDNDQLYLARLGSALRELKDPQAAKTLAWTYGLFGAQPLELSEQAERLLTTVADVVRIREEAERKLATLLKRGDYT